METCKTWADFEQFYSLLIPVFKEHAKDGPFLFSFRGMFQESIPCALLLPSPVPQKARILERRIKEYFLEETVLGKESPYKVHPMILARRYEALITAFEDKSFIISARMSVVHPTAKDDTYAPARGMVELYCNPLYMERTSRIMGEIASFLAHTPLNT